MTSGLSYSELNEPFSVKNTVDTITVTPSEATYRNMNIYYEASNQVSRSLCDVIPQFYPIEKVKPFKTGDDVITSIEDSPSSIGIISDETYHQYILPFRNAKTTDELPSIRHILTVALEMPTLLLSPKFRIPGLETSAYQQVASKMYPTYTPDWYDLQFPDRPFRIGTTAPTSSSYRVLQKIIDSLINYTASSTQRSMKQKPSIVFIEFSEDSIDKAFQDNRIDAYFALCAHPNTVVYTLVRDKSYQLMGLRGIDPTKYKTIFPRTTEVILNTVAYPDYRNITLRSMEHPIHIVANKTLTTNVINTFIQSIFENFLRIKTGTGITNAVELFQFRTQMSDFSPAYLYPRYSEFALHSGVDKYFRSIGVITTNPAPECGYQVGISDCKKEPYFNPYRIIR
jgi:TRAP-type uncharacterized transport system substrate-binding protein